MYLGPAFMALTDRECKLKRSVNAERWEGCNGTGTERWSHNKLGPSGEQLFCRPRSAHTQWPIDAPSISTARPCSRSDHVKTLSISVSRQQFTEHGVSRIQGDDASRQSLMLGSNCRRRSLTKASTNGVVALNAWYSRMGPYRTFV